MSDSKSVDSGNIISLPDTVAFWSCGLCSANIEASMKEFNGFPPAIVQTPSLSSDSPKMVFCGPCVENRAMDIEQYVSDVVSPKNQIAIPSVDAWKVFESPKMNRFGEKLRLTVWATAFGLAAALSLVKKGSDRIICYNLAGLSKAELRVSVEYLNSIYQADFGFLKEKTAKKRGKYKAPLKDYLPMFRCMLVATGRSFAVYDLDEWVIRIGYVGIHLSSLEMTELSNVLTASADFLETNSTAELERLALLRKKAKSKNLRDYSSFKKTHPDVIVQTNLSDSKSIEVTKTAFTIGLKIGGVKLDFEPFDFLDMARVLEHLTYAVQETIPRQRTKAIDAIRLERYIRLEGYVSMNHQIILADLGWNFENATGSF